MILPPYLPEIDGGRAIRGKAFRSFDTWLPKEQIPNPRMLLRAATTSSIDKRTGKVIEVCLAKETEFHVVVARHVMSIIDEFPNIIVPEIDWPTPLAGTDKVGLRQGQLEAWDAFSSTPNGVLSLAPGKGKTVLALKKAAHRGYPTLVIVNNGGLLTQWVERARDHLGLSNSDIGVVQQDRAEWDRPLVVAMIQTLASRFDTIGINERLRFGTIIWDECHHISAAGFSRTANLFMGERTGLSATTERADGLEGVYLAHLGPVIFSDTVGDLDANIFFKRIDDELTPAEEKLTLDTRKDPHHMKLCGVLADREPRNRIIVEEVMKALDKGRKIIVLSHPRRHPAKLLEAFTALGETKYTAGLVVEATGNEDRTKIIRDSDVTFASFKIAMEGLDVAALDTVFFATPFSSVSNFRQGKGRVERAVPGKNHPLCVIFEDTKVGMASGMCYSLKRWIRGSGGTYRDV